MTNSRKSLATRTIKKDSERQKFLNRERNPLVTTMNEATQTINPLTGRAYEDFGERGDYEDSSISNRVFIVAGGEEREEIFNTWQWFKMYDPGKAFIIQRDSGDLEFYNSQLALARKEVRDGNLTPEEYTSYVLSVNRVISKLEDAKLPVSVINTPEALDRAVSESRWKSLNVDEARENNIIGQMRIHFIGNERIKYSPEKNYN